MASIQEIRQQYPQYNDMSDDALADAMHKKFYADMPRDQFNDKIGYKPVEPAKSGPDYAKMGAGQVALRALTNVPSSAYHVGSDIAHAVVHPIDTAKGMGTLALGGLEKGYEGYGGGQAARGAISAASPIQGLYNAGRGLGLYGDTGSGQSVEAAGQFFKDRYGGTENIKRTIAEDPIGTLADLSTVFTGGETLPGRVGAMSGRLSRITDPINIATQGVTKGASLAARPFMAGGGPGSSRISRALERDKMTPQAATAAGQEIAKDRPGMQTLAHAGGENVRGLVEDIAQTPGAARTDLIPKLKAQQKEQLERLSTDLKDMTGTKKTAVKSVEDSIETRRAEAHPAYKSAYESGDRVIWDSELERLAGAKDFRDAMGQAVGGWERSAIADGYGAMNPRAMVENGIVHFQHGGVPAYPNLQFWDYTKHALDQMIQAERNPITGAMSRKGAELTTIKNKMVTVLDREVPGYAEARAKYSGPSRYMNAIEDGKALSRRTQSAEEVTNDLRNMSEADREGYRTGVVSDIVQKMRGDPAKLPDLTKYLRSPEMRSKIAAIMPTPELAEKWQRRLNLEERSSELAGRALGGSPTARRLAERQDASMLVDLVNDVVKSGGRPTSLINRLLGSIPERIRNKWMAKADERIARMLTSPGALQHLDLALKGGMARRTPLLMPEAGANLRQAASQARPYTQGAFQAGRLTQLKSDAKDALKDKNKKLTQDQRQALRAVARGEPTLDQRQKAYRLIRQYGGPQ